MSVEKTYGIDTKCVLRICMVIALFAAYTFSIVFERVPHADGAGFDGVLYREMCQDFVGMWQDGQISIYYLQKCLPFVLVNIIDIVTGISNSLYTLIGLHYLALLFSIIAFFKITSYLQFKISTELISYLLIFWQFIFIKFSGYYPYQGDPFAYSLILWLFYFFITHQKYKMLGVSIIGAFVWQSMLPLALILFVMPKQGFSITDGNNMANRDDVMLKIFKGGILLGFIAASLALLYAAMRNGGIDLWSQRIPYCFFDLPLWVLCISSIALLALGYFALKPLNFSIVEFFKHIVRNLSWKHVVIAICVYVGMKFLIFELANPALDPPISTKVLIKRIVWEPYILPLKFCSTHLAACGLVLPLFILMYNRILKLTSEHSVGYITAIAMVLVLGLQSETRYVLNFLPFVIFAICMALDKIVLKSGALIALCAVQLFLSGIWYHINTPDLPAALEVVDSRAYVQSDIAQRYFFFYGPWQGLKAYVMFMSAFVVIMTILFVGKKRRWFVK